MIKTKISQKIKKQKEYKRSSTAIYNMEEKWKRHIGNPVLARIVADITGDGHLQLQDWRGLVSFYSNDINTIKTINKKFKSLFGIEGKIYTKKNKNIQYKIFFISKPLAIFLNKIGIPKGNKTETLFSVPEWIITGDRKVQSAYLCGLFTGEGSIFFNRQSNGKKRWRIGIEMYKRLEKKEEGKKFMEQIRSMFSNFGIKTSPVHFGRKNKRKNGTYSIAVKLDIEAGQFSKFYKEIGFDDKRKTNKLLKAIAEAQASCAEVSSQKKTPNPSG